MATNGVVFQRGVTRSVSINISSEISRRVPKADQLRSLLCYVSVGSDVSFFKVDSSPFNASVLLPDEVLEMFRVTLSTTSPDVSIDVNFLTAVVILDGKFYCRFFTPKTPQKLYLGLSPMLFFVCV